MKNKINSLLKSEISLLTFASTILPHPKYWPKKLHEFRMDRHYYSIFGRHINFKNPQSFNEKMQTYMLYYNNPDLRRVSDKIEFKNYVSEKLGEGHTAKLLGVWDKVEDIDFSKLTQPYVLKSNCCDRGYGICFIRDNNFDPEEYRKWFRSWLDYRNTAQMSCSSAYWQIKPMIFAEEMLGDGSKSLTDYKFFCFNGKAFCVYTAQEHFVNGHPQPSKISFYDMDWNVLDVSYKGQDTSPVKKPKHFEKMREYAEILSRGFPFIRVDFYETEEKPILGEMTYDSSGGYHPFVPESFDYELGEQFVF